MIIDTEEQNIIVKSSKDVNFYNIEYVPQMSIDDIDYAAILLTYEDDEILL